jgi:hypothetical protein
MGDQRAHVVVVGNDRVGVRVLEELLSLGGVLTEDIAGRADRALRAANGERRAEPPRREAAA